jgi:cation diffusion facilitator CzcD-associated flavoprotein CzcO
VVKLSRSPTVAIIGAGVGGVAASVKLKKAGITGFTVFEQSDGAGGTWHDNTYPGCEVDIHSHFYSFSFMPHDWSHTHGTQPMLKRYIESTIDHFGIGANFRFNTKVERVAWLPERSGYLVTLGNGEELAFDAVISCVGLLNNPKYPTWPGLETFQGPKFHTARWDHASALENRRVAVVGTGSTASQVVPAIAPFVSELMVFQREPGWVFPKEEREFTDRERRRYRKSVLYRRWSRFKQFRRAGSYTKALWEGTPLNQQTREIALRYIEDTVPDQELRAIITPDYPFGCKRTVQATTYYPALNRENVTVIPHAVERVTTTGLVAGGAEYDADVLIMATGFQPQNFLATFDVIGADGRSLREVWGDTPKAFLGITVPGFPNFFMIYGPNTNGGGSIICNNELQAGAIARAIKRLRRGATSVDTRIGAFERYVKWIDSLAGKHLTGQRMCHNYYHSPSGRNVTQLTLSHPQYAVATWILPIVGWRTGKRSPKSSRLLVTTDLHAD